MTASNVMTIDQAHVIATSGDKIFHVEGQVRGEWYSDCVIEFLVKHRHDKCQVTLKTDQIISVRLSEE
jgi:hypothetical protein